MKGVFSIDAFVALLLMLFAVLLMQGFVGLSFDNSNSFGANFEAKAEAIRVGSIMNTFYSTRPNDYDYIQLNGSSARAFKDSSANFTAAMQGSLLNVTLVNRFGNKSYLYPVAKLTLANWRISK